MTISFPAQGQWIPNINQLTDSAASLLAVAGESLDLYGFGEDYTRRVYSHGPIPWKPNVSQILVTLPKMHMGRAGQEQFQFADGALGRISQRTMTFDVDLVRRWPTTQGGQAPRLPDDAVLMENASLLWRDALIVWSAFQALAQGGVVTVPPVAPIIQDNILVGPMTPKGPQGALAGMLIPVQIQF